MKSKNFFPTFYFSLITFHLLSPSYGSGVAVINGGGEVGVGGSGVVSGGTAVGVNVGVGDGVGETAVVVGVGVGVGALGSMVKLMRRGSLWTAVLLFSRRTSQL